MFKISFHSVCDLITNSSTTIYSWYDNSVGACKELINEFLHTFNIPGTADDLFFIGAFPESPGYYYSDDEQEEDVVNNLNASGFEELKSKILRGEIKEPTWLTDLRKQARDYDYYQDISFYIEAKKPEHELLAKKLKTFLLSVENDYANG